MWSYSPLNGLSVPFSRRTWYCSGVSSRRHSSWVFLTFAGTESFLSVPLFSVAKGACVTSPSGCSGALLGLELARLGRILARQVRVLLEAVADDRALGGEH